MKATEQYIPVCIKLYKVIQILEPVNEILQCDLWK